MTKAERTGTESPASPKIAGQDKRRPVIVTAALTGAIHTPSMSPYLPVTPEEIVAEGIRAAQAGAAVLHVHARDPETGKPDQSVAAFADILPKLKAQTDCVINVTTGGSPFMPVEERVQPVAHYGPELASLNMGSMNFGLFGMLDRYDTFEHAWEREHLENSRDLAFRNTFKEIEYILTTCGARGTRFEFECYDISHLYTLKHFLDRGLVTGPLFVQSVFGLLGGIGNHAEDVMMMRRTADRLFGDQYVWSVLGAGAAQQRIAASSVAMGGNLRVGLEDSLWKAPGKLATTSAEQIELAKGTLAAQGCRVATPAEAREMLALKGKDQVNF
ncbi:3-keto-5-aminohexanoate cleavage protein [Sulfitobacter mediterraneus]|jgi:3,5-dioxohexanoate:acetyl-CoA acetone transferase|uniref:3-keto-5-aminohexanoate cleavage protein n=1 Tax=Sulfitobacter mediterraneus TaxID=83219 RepID=UPI00193337FC|nr:3-keto-5-aminohexanoate cleavage protein [Sulfitobacter mediterraneus]MBM1634509.1 3-keto-5-aminohexanoate cleavage protein [Sulfitobacter mediterraneus]MBM1642326.1 3-keto-5-aminohexanoate cleavage protein [Sulfitobacter mediterraneus]MBM1646375.1 3-keto-5-aminohexanoate cleavage protein [Sulfitobacter mediterraneus]MBM1650421.1 3-keto-5-aminohexanoate cleavage protein [Sulfitobacter mediterraneus]MBM1654443.1 3-keto-5-aminohexanoate cleavage protein [Sulfitobacter mediterraneus]